jgi:hypothetical protein
MTWWRRLSVGLGWFLLQGQAVLAQVRGGSTRIPGTDFLVELYNVTNNVYVPLLAALAVVVGAANLIFGWMRMGTTMGRVFLGIGLLGLGATWVGQTVGATVALGLLV